jgi:hypothetical protein
MKKRADYFVQNIIEAQANSLGLNIFLLLLQCGAAICGKEN